jgi:hypothetical protein
MRTIALLSTLVLSLTFGAGCGDDAPSCSKVVDHIGKLMGMEIPADQKPGMIAECEKEPASKRACAMKATTPDQLMACK